MVLPFYGLTQVTDDATNYYIYPASVYEEEGYKNLEAQRKTLEEQAAARGLDKADLQRLAGAVRLQMPQTISSAGFNELSQAQRLNPFGYYQWSPDDGSNHATNTSFTGVWRYGTYEPYRQLAQQYAQANTVDYLKSRAVATGEEEYNKWKADQFGYSPANPIQLGSDAYMSLQPGDFAPGAPEGYDPYYQYEIDKSKHDALWAAKRQKGDEIQKKIDEARAYYLSGLEDPAEIKRALDVLRAAIDESTAHWSTSIAAPPQEPKGYQPTGKPLPVYSQDFLEDYVSPKASTEVAPETEKNLEILSNQADSGVQGSQDFLTDYVAKGGEGAQEIAQALPSLPEGPKGMDRAPGSYYAPGLIIPIDTPGSSFNPGEAYGIIDPFKNSPQTGPGLSTRPKYGPRGEDLGEVAWNTPAIPMGPYTPVRNYGTRTNPSYAPSTRDTHNNPGGARVIPIQFVQENQPVDVRVARAAEKSDVQRERLAQQSEFDLSKEKQLASAKAADAYRRSAATEDPFRAAARVG